MKISLTVNGKTLWENVQDAPLYNDAVILPLDAPLREDGGMCVMRGNLAPNGAVLSSASVGRMFSAQMTPPCASMICLEMASPSPE